MTPENNQPKHQPAMRSTKDEAGCPLEDRVKGIEADVGAIRKMAVGIYDRIDDLIRSTDAIHEAIVKSDRHDYDPLTDGSDLDDLEE